ncbi:hypothetical protein [Acinetobacter sp.]|uniref:hypothetical protein n=1 Tax=Acinetobacter sp. TaxID=472 RepID=UPI0038902968
MKLLKEMLALSEAAETEIPKKINGRPLSDFNVLISVGRGEHTVYVKAPRTNPRGRGMQKDLKTFDNEKEAEDFKKKVIAAGAKDFQPFTK